MADAQTNATVLVKEAEEVTAVALPELKQELITIQQADPATETQIRRRMDELDMGNTQSIIKFGSKAQEDLTAISDEMLDGVRNKDVGPAGDVAAQAWSTPSAALMSHELAPGATAAAFSPASGPGSPARARRKSPISSRKYEQVRGQIDKIAR